MLVVRSAVGVAPPVAAGFPNAATTGLPAGTNLSPLSMPVDQEFVVTTPGQVFEDLYIEGQLNIRTGTTNRANDVIIRRCQLDWGVYNQFADGGAFTIEDCIIGIPGEVLLGYTVGDHAFTARRLHIFGHDDGFRAGGDDVDVQDCLIRMAGVDTSHSDGIQDFPSCSNLLLKHNTFDQSEVPPEGMNACVFIASGDGSTNVTIDNNLCVAGGYGMDIGANGGLWVVKHNRVVDNSWRFGPVDLNGTSGNVDEWTDNTTVTINANYEVTGTVATVPLP